MARLPKPPVCRLQPQSERPDTHVFGRLSIHVIELDPSCPLFPFSILLLPVPRSLSPVPCPSFPVPCPPFLVPCSSFPVPRSLSPVPCSSFPVPRSLFLVPCSPFPVPCPPFPAPCLGLQPPPSSHTSPPNLVWSNFLAVCGRLCPFLSSFLFLLLTEVSLGDLQESWRRGKKPVLRHPEVRTPLLKVSCEGSSGLQFPKKGIELNFTVRRCLSR